MRQCAENQFRVLETDIVGACERDVATGNARDDTRLIIRRSECEREIWMPTDERAELAASIAAGPEYADWNLIHRECIIMHCFQVNPLIPRNMKLSARVSSATRHIA